MRLFYSHVSHHYARSWYSSNSQLYNIYEYSHECGQLTYYCKSKCFEVVCNVYPQNVTSV